MPSAAGRDMCDTALTGIRRVAIVLTRAPEIVSLTGFSKNSRLDYDGCRRDCARPREVT
jgi:hypothetical protein